MKHPIERQNKIQAAFLKKLAGKERSFHRRLFNIGNAKICYHELIKDYPPKEEDFKDWLVTLDELQKRSILERGFESCKTDLNFTKYVLESRGIIMDKWMKDNLRKSDYTEYSKEK